MFSNIQRGKRQRATCSSNTGTQFAIHRQPPHACIGHDTDEHKLQEEQIGTVRDTCVHTRMVMTGISCFPACRHAPDGKDSVPAALIEKISRTIRQTNVPHLQVDVHFAPGGDQQQQGEGPGGRVGGEVLPEQSSLGTQPHLDYAVHREDVP